LFTGWLWLDPATGLVIAVAIVWSTWGLLRDSVALALNAVPEHIDPRVVRTYLSLLAGVAEVHDLHIWAMSTTETALTVHLVSLCETASWCERAAGLVSGRLLAIARAPFSVDSLTVLAGMALVIAAEIIVLGYAKSSLYRLLHPTKSTWADIVWFLVRIFGLQSLVVAVASLGLTSYSNQLAMKYAGFHVLTKIKDPVLQGAAYVIAFDFIAYWVHRGRHAFGWWWEFHKHHHSATEFNAITQARTHPLDGVAIVL